ncbi:hypothetical protein BU16DRAFT_543025 [Lophium mytilinum]|uniref:Uncharacterized protein n=1 Tax=Lophium mytilinum TaxID=390894 RepID=A0A6A6QF97_9PEZI|nr:hypothetical protein BU16DRAFT_543025 [Lophium mytilinum]
MAGLNAPVIGVIALSAAQRLRAHIGSSPQIMKGVDLFPRRQKQQGRERLLRTGRRHVAFEVCYVVMVVHASDAKCTPEGFSDAFQQTSEKRMPESQCQAQARKRRGMWRISRLSSGGRSTDIAMRDLNSSVGRICLTRDKADQDADLGRRLSEGRQETRKWWRLVLQGAAESSPLAAGVPQCTTACCSTCWVFCMNLTESLPWGPWRCISKYICPCGDVLYESNATGYWYKSDTGRECRGYGGVVASRAIFEVQYCKYPKFAALCPLPAASTLESSGLLEVTGTYRMLKIAVPRAPSQQSQYIRGKQAFAEDGGDVMQRSRILGDENWETVIANLVLFWWPSLVLRLISGATTPEARGFLLFHEQEGEHRDGLPSAGTAGDELDTNRATRGPRAPAASKLQHIGHGGDRVRRARDDGGGADKPNWHGKAGAAADLSAEIGRLRPGKPDERGCAGNDGHKRHPSRLRVPGPWAVGRGGELVHLVVDLDVACASAHLKEELLWIWISAHGSRLRPVPQRSRLNDVQSASVAQRVMTTTAMPSQPFQPFVGGELCVCWSRRRARSHACQKQRTCGQRAR